MCTDSATVLQLGYRLHNVCTEHQPESLACFHLISCLLLPHRDQAYALRNWDKAPTIDNFTIHPFMRQFEGQTPAPQAALDAAAAPEPAASAAAATNGLSSTVAKALAPPPGGAQNRPEQQQSRVASPPPARPAEPLFDLLSLDEVSLHLCVRSI